MPAPVLNLRDRLLVERYVLRKRTGRFLLPLRQQSASNGLPWTKPVWRIKKVSRVFAWKLRSVTHSKADDAVDQNNAMIDQMQGVIDRLPEGVDVEIGDVDGALEETDVDDRSEPDHQPLVLPLASTDADTAAENLQHFFALAREIPINEMPNFAFDYQLPYPDDYATMDGQDTESETGSMSSVLSSFPEMDRSYTMPDEEIISSNQPHGFSAQDGQQSAAPNQKRSPSLAPQPSTDPEYPELDLGSDEGNAVESTQILSAMTTTTQEQEEDKSCPQLGQLSMSGPVSAAGTISPQGRLVHEDSGFMASPYSTPTADETPSKVSKRLRGKGVLLVHEDSGLPTSPLSSSSPQVRLIKQDALGSRGAPLMQAKSSHSSNIMHMLKEDSGLSFSPMSSPGSPGLQLGRLPTFQGLSAPRNTFKARLAQLNATRKSVTASAQDSRDQELVQEMGQEDERDSSPPIPSGSHLNLKSNTISSPFSREAAPQRATQTRLETLHPTKKNSPLSRHMIYHDDR